MRISDWSSDVCSSDLEPSRPDRPPFLGAVQRQGCEGRRQGQGRRRGARRPGTGAAAGRVMSPDSRYDTADTMGRSEERRVGKEGVSKGRYWWAPIHSKKKNKTIYKTQKNTKRA